jgi:hypothetical protein
MLPCQFYVCQEGIGMSIEGVGSYGFRRMEQYGAGWNGDPASRSTYLGGSDGPRFRRRDRAAEDSLNPEDMKLRQEQGFNRFVDNLAAEHPELNLNTDDLKALPPDQRKEAVKNILTAAGIDISNLPEGVHHFGPPPEMNDSDMLDMFIQQLTEKHPELSLDAEAIKALPPEERREAIKKALTDAGIDLSENHKAFDLDNGVSHEDRFDNFITKLTQDHPELNIDVASLQALPPEEKRAAIKKILTDAGIEFLGKGKFAGVPGQQPDFDIVVEKMKEMHPELILDAESLKILAPEARKAAIKQAFTDAGIEIPEKGDFPEMRTERGLNRGDRMRNRFSSRGGDMFFGGASAAANSSSPNISVDSSSNALVNNMYVSSEDEDFRLEMFNQFISSVKQTIPSAVNEEAERTLSKGQKKNASDGLLDYFKADYNTDTLKKNEKGNKQFNSWLIKNKLFEFV